MNKLFILTNSARIIPQIIHETESIPIESIKNYFIEKGFNVKVFTFGEFLEARPELSKEISNSYFLYSSSQYVEYYSSIEDILLYIIENGGIIVPSFLHFRAHENKYFQELVKSKYQIKSPKSYLVSTIEEGSKILKKISYPFVAKLTNGYASETVKLINSEKEGYTYLNKQLNPLFNFWPNPFRYYKRIREYFGKYPLKVGKIIFQEFIDNVDHDWKILVFGNKIFTLKRYNRKNDFRASGSGLFDIQSIPDKMVLDFAVETKEILRTPWVSLDIICKDGNCYLIEYQCVHFGLLTIVNSTKHYEIINNSYIEVKGKIDLDKLFAEELYTFIMDDLNHRNNER